MARLFLSIIILISITATSPALAGIAKHTLDVSGYARYYLVYTPRHIKTPAPAVFVLHGGTGKAEGSLRNAGFEGLADKYGFIVVYPAGVDNQWLDGRDTDFSGKHPGLDDVVFLKTVMDEIIKKSADANRIYFTGISNGAIMSYRMACDLSDRIAAIAPVAGALPDGFNCNPKHPVPVIAFNGTEDKFIKIKGGWVGPSKIEGTKGATIPVMNSIALWEQVNGCKESPETIELPRKDKSDVTTVILYHRKNCNVLLYTINGGGHTWPGHTFLWERLFGFIVGKTTHQIDATNLIWDFFSDKARN